jgi:hypothetical protein
MNFYKTARKYYCGVDLQSRTMYICVVGRGRCRSAPSQPAVRSRPLPPLRSTAWIAPRSRPDHPSPVQRRPARQAHHLPLEPGGSGQRLLGPSVRQSIATDLALADHLEVAIGELELAVLRQTRIHDPNALALLMSVPGRGVSPSSNSSHSGWSPPLMPRQAAKACPARTHPASWAPTPGSDRSLIGHPSRSFVAMAVSRSSSSSLPLTRAPHILAPCPGTNTPAPLLNGTARGNRCVSRSWERRSLSYPDTAARARSHNGSAGRTSIGVWCKDRPAPARETKTETEEAL